MCKQPPFYKLSMTITRSVQFEGPQFTTEGANCYCVAGETQNCVHVTVLLFTLAEVSPAAYTSLPCALVCKKSSCSRGKSLFSVASLVSHFSLSRSSTEVSDNVEGSSGCSRRREREREKCYRCGRLNNVGSTFGFARDGPIKPS